MGDRPCSGPAMLPRMGPDAGHRPAGRAQCPDVRQEHDRKRYDARRQLWTVPLQPASTANINDVFGVPVAFAYRTKSKSAQERFETGAIGARDAMVYRHPYGSGNARGFLGGFLVNLFSDMEFFAGMTPGYIAGASERPGRTSWGTAMPYWEDTWVEKKNAFSLTLDAGMTLNYSIWRFDLKLTPAFHYNLTNNYLYHLDSGENGPEVLKSTTTPLRWFFTLNGGLSFRF